MALTKDHTAKLNKVDDGFYRWKDTGLPESHGWTIQRIKVRGAATYYEVRSEGFGLFFEAANLKEVRERLPKVQYTYMVDETLLDGVEKTEGKLDQEAQARPQEEKLAAADKVICDIVGTRVEQAQAEYDKIMSSLDKEGARRFPHEVAWSAAAVRGGYLLRHCKLLLVERRQDGKPFTPKDRLDMVERHHYRFLNDLLSNTMYTTDSTNAFRRAVAQEERAAAVDYFRLLEHCLRIYAEEYVEDAPKAVTSEY
jgi:hypothetical protein